MQSVRGGREAIAVIAEAARRFRPRREPVYAKRTWRFLSALHAAQQKLLACKGKRIAALCSRRAGKSFLAAAMLLQAAGDHPNSLCAYFATTREQARRIMWRELKQFNRTWALRLKFNETKMICTLPNGAEIYCLGALNAKDVDRVRGVPFVLVVIDEAASFPVRAARNHDTKKFAGEEAPTKDDTELERDLLYRLWREVLQPTMLDFQGRVLMLGTPAAHCSGFFFNVTHPTKSKRRKGWDVFQWTVLDNPFVPKVKTEEVPDSAAWLAQMRLEENISEDDPSYVREWLGQWMQSADALVYYSFSEGRNVFGTPLPPGITLSTADRPDKKKRDWLREDFFEGIADLYTGAERGRRGNRAIASVRESDWFYGVAVDLGYDDPTVIGVFMWRENDPHVYLVAVHREKKMIPSRIAAEIKRIEKKVGALSFVVIDQGGGAGKMIAEEFQQQWQIPCQGAEKTKKPTFIELCNGEFKTGRFKIHARCLPVLDEISVLQWDPLHPGRKEDQRFANDACDMMLYGWRAAAARRVFDGAEEPAEIIPERGSRESWQRRAERQEAELERRLKRRQDPEADEDDTGVWQMARRGEWSAPD